MIHYAEQPDLFPMRGGCSCGQTSYTLELPPLIVHCCHCTACQRQQGAAFAINAIVESSAISMTPRHPDDPRTDAAGNILSSNPAVGALLNAVNPTKTSSNGGSSSPTAITSKDQLLVTTALSRSGLGHYTARCPSCHTGLWSHYAGAGKAVTYLRVGTLDRAGQVEPDVHIYTRSRRGFVTISDGKPRFEAYYPDRRVFYRPDCVDRVRAVEAASAEWRSSMSAALGQ